MNKKIIGEIIIGIILFITIIIGTFFWFNVGNLNNSLDLFQQLDDQLSENNNKIIKNNMETKSPSEVYRQREEEINLTKNLDEVVELMIKYRSVEAIEKFENTRAMLAALTEDQRPAMYGHSKNNLTGFTVINEKITENQAILDVVKEDTKEEGTVKMVLENGQWKISEEWTIKEISNEAQENMVSCALQLNGANTSLYLKINNQSVTDNGKEEWGGGFFNVSIPVNRYFKNGDNEITVSLSPGSGDANVQIILIEQNTNSILGDTKTIHIKEAQTRILPFNMADDVKMEEQISIFDF